MISLDLLNSPTFKIVHFYFAHPIRTCPGLKMEPTDKPTQSKIDLALPEEKTPDEIQLEASGDIDALQRYRRKLSNQRSSGYMDRMRELFATEEKLQKIVQQEDALAKKPESIYIPLFYGKNQKAELQALSKRYWLLEREWWKHRSSFVEGPLIRAFDLWRSHPLWYMHRVLVEDCMRKGGCCSRSCGCCVNRAFDKTRQLGAGHCTTACGCCNEARGFQLTKEEEKTLSKDFYVSTMKTQHRMKINRASIWGLCLDSHDSPFDMIVIPPGYEKLVPKEHMAKRKDEEVDESFVLLDEVKEEVEESGY